MYESQIQSGRSSCMACLINFFDVLKNWVLMLGNIIVSVNCFTNTHRFYNQNNQGKGHLIMLLNVFVVWSQMTLKYQEKQNDMKICPLNEDQFYTYIIINYVCRILVKRQCKRERKYTTKIFSCHISAMYLLFPGAPPNIPVSEDR